MSGLRLASQRARVRTLWRFRGRSLVFTLASLCALYPAVTHLLVCPLASRPLHPRHGLMSRGASATAVDATSVVAADFVARWVEKEIARHPVILFVDLSSNSSQGTRLALQEARIHFHQVDISSMDHLPLPGNGESSAGQDSWSGLVTSHLRSLGCSDPPVLFVGGQHVDDAVAKLAVGEELQSLCEEAGATFLEPQEPASKLPWTRRGENLRWLPPKDMGGRRWYQDDPGSATYEGEQFDAARIEYNIDSLSNGAGTENRGRFSGAAKALLRAETNLDKPDGNGFLNPTIPPFCDVDLLMRPDVGFSLYQHCIDKKGWKNITEEDAAREGLPLEQLLWVYKQDKKKILEELHLRQRRSDVLLNLDVVSLREALMDEMRRELKFSPTGQGVVPGVVQWLSGPEFRQERFADTEVPLLLAVVSKKQPACWHLRDRLTFAAKRLLRKIRVVQVEGSLYPEVPREFGVMRYPTLIWLSARNGQELARLVGVPASSIIVDQTLALLEHRQLPVPGEVPPKLLDQPRWYRNGGMLVEEERAQRWNSKRSWRRAGVSGLPT